VADTGFGADETTGAGGGSAGTTGAVMFCWFAVWFVVCRKGSGLARSSSHVQLESETQARLHAIQRFLGVRGFMGTLTCHPRPLDLIFGAANGVLYLPSKEQAMADFRIAVLAGDGIGPEVIDQAMRVVDAAAKLDQASFKWSRFPWNSAYYREHGVLL